jgi:pimeloyl-ACP methyl ester carboxylesterase
MRATTDTAPLYPAGAGALPEIPGVAIEHEFYELPAGQFHVARAGDRTLPAIMLVHGFPQHWGCWRGVVEALAGEAHLVMPDLRGAGWSAVPTTSGSYSKNELAGDLRQLLDAMGIEQIAVVGHDWGGFASQLLALDVPDRVTRLLALSIPPVIPVRRPPLREMLRMYYQLVFAAPGSATVISRMPQRLAKGIRQDVQQRDAFTREDADAYAEPFRDPQRAKAAQLMYRSFILGDAARIYARTRSQRFAMPVRFVLSQYDAYIPPAFAADASRTGEHVEAFVQDRTGHFLPDEDPGYVAEQIREFILPAATPLG